MSAPPFLLREYEHLQYEKIPDSDILALERAVDRLGIPALQFLRHTLQARHYVGAIYAGSTGIEVVPKICARREDDLSFLIFLLSYTRRLNIRRAGMADLAEFRGSFLEVWIRSFGEELHGLLRRRMRREYRELTEATEFLRGKLLIDRMNNGLAELRMRYPCRFEVFTEDNHLNRILRFCNHLLLGQTRVPGTKALLRENDNLLADVALAPVTTDQLDQIHLNRLSRHYEPILQLCRLLLRHAGLDVRAGTIRQYAILFDMNRLSEEFVAEFVRRHATEIPIGDNRRIRDVSIQHHLGNLFGEFRMQVDLAITDDSGHTVLVDTKYKGLDPDEPHHGLSQVDFYQMYGYARASQTDHRAIILLYPRTEGVTGTYHSGDVTLYVRTVDLERMWRSAARGDVGGLTEVGRALTVPAAPLFSPS